MKTHWSEHLIMAQLPRYVSGFHVTDSYVFALVDLITNLNRQHLMHSHQSLHQKTANW